MVLENCDTIKVVYVNDVIHVFLNDEDKIQIDTASMANITSEGKGSAALPMLV
jgi:hypothetical protein